MWNFQSNRNRLRDRMLIAAPEANPHQFVQRVLLARDRQARPGVGARTAGRAPVKTAILDSAALPATQS